MLPLVPVLYGLRMALLLGNRLAYEALSRGRVCALLVSTVTLAICTFIRQAAGRPLQLWLPHLRACNLNMSCSRLQLDG